MEEMMDEGANEMPQDKGPAGDETSEEVKSILIESNGDGSFDCKVTGQDGSEQAYQNESPEDVMKRVKDDMMSPHMKEHGTFASLRNKIMGRKSFHARPGQSKMQAANAVTASIKDKLYGKSWRKD